MIMKSEKNTILAMASNLKEDDARALVDNLDSYKGSYAVRYFLEALCMKGNEHTLQSAIKLIEEVHSE